GLLTMAFTPETSSGWNRFMQCSALTGDLGVYVPVALEYFEDAFESLCAEQIYYVELRVSEGVLRNEDGSPVQGADFYDFFRQVRKRVQARHPHFDLKLIFCVWRGLSEEALAQSFNEARQVQRAYPDLVVGGDLVGEEDTGPTLADSHLLLRARAKDPHFNL